MAKKKNKAVAKKSKKHAKKIAKKGMIAASGPAGY